MPFPVSKSELASHHKLFKMGRLSGQWAPHTALMAGLRSDPPRAPAEGLAMKSHWRGRPLSAPGRQRRMQFISPGHECGCPLERVRNVRKMNGLCRAQGPWAQAMGPWALAVANAYVMIFKTKKSKTNQMQGKGRASGLVRAIFMGAGAAYRAGSRRPISCHLESAVAAVGS